MFKRILCLGLLASATIFAQGKKGGGGGGNNMGSGGFASASRMDILNDQLKLTKEQRKEVKATLDDAQKQATPVHEQIVKSRLAVGEAIAAGKSQAEIDAAVTGEGVLESQMTSIELHAFATVVAGLDKEQQQRGSVLFQMIHGMFNGKNWMDVTP
jgi:Spy/CpxP family protein refolding chaperone